jgi:hypothetical protein
MGYYPGWPYAAKAVIEHEWVDEDHLVIYVTFDLPMNILWKPLSTKWYLLVDGDHITIGSTTWNDCYTLMLTSGLYEYLPYRVQLKYLGPDVLLRTTWHKQWEPWGYIPSRNITS